MIIESKVNEIVTDLFSNNVPMDIECICAHFNILLSYNDDLSCLMYYKNYPIIHLKNGDKRTMWEEFTHELGHFVLHKADQRNMNDMVNRKQETEANKFSILFQMPEELIKRYSLFSSNQLMSFFEVSAEKALERLQLLFNYYSSEAVI